MKNVYQAEEIAKAPIGVTTVKSSTSNQPLTISSNPRKRNLLQCNCKNNVWQLICEHTLAAAINLGITFDYLVEVKNKVLTCRKNKGFIIAVAMNASIKEKCLKKPDSNKKQQRNEINYF